MSFGTAAWSVLPPVAGPQDLTALTLKQSSDIIRRRDVSPVELTQAYLKRIDQYNPSLNAFITITRDQAIAAAREMEGEQKSGKWRGPLHGIPIALKDNIDTAGIKTTAASGVFKDRVPTEDSEVVVRLKKAGAILVGKLNLHEFALGELLRSHISGRFTIHGRWTMCREDHPAVPPLRLGSLRRYLGDRHRRLDPHTFFVLRCCRSQAHLWPRQQPRSDSNVLDAGPRWSYMQNR
jgi:hypothetical protein